MRKCICNKITPEYIRDTFEYNPDIGALIWKNPPSKREKIGEIAGSVNANGYRRIGILASEIYAHRAIWAYVYGVMPTGTIDHIDEDRTNNRIENLRDVDRAINSYNQHSPQKNNTSGYRGVCYNRSCNKWQANITIERRHIHLGLFNKAEEAHEAYILAKKNIHRKAYIEQEKNNTSVPAIS